MNKVFCIVIGLIITINSVFAEAITDELVEQTLKGKTFPPVETNTKYNYESIDRALIKLKVVNAVKTKNLQEGDIINFYVKQNVKYKNKTILKADTAATGVVKTFMTGGMNGVPGQIIIDDFEIPGIDSNKLKSTYIKRGSDRTLLVLPLKYALTFLYPLGSLTNIIFGGNAKITKNDTINIYYYPEWNN